MKLTKPILTGVVVLCVVISLLAAKAIIFYKQYSFRSQAWERPVRSKGDPRAQIRVIEFTDFQCPACSKAADTVEEVLKKYPGKIYFEHKYYPLAMHPFARQASVYAECAAEQGKFWPFHDVIFRSQSSWAKMAAVDEYFSQLAVSLGVDGVRLAVCVNNPLVKEKVEKDVAEGKKLGVTSTPTFFVNGKITVGGSNFKKAIEAIMETNAQ